MSDYEDLYEPAPDNEDILDDTYIISEKGLEKLVEWVRFQVQLDEMTSEEEGKIGNDEFSEIPYLVGFLVPEVCYYRGIRVPGSGSDVQ